jgi:hypothetical protein
VGGKKDRSGRMKEKIKARIKAEDGTTIKVFDSSPVECEVHGVKTTWGALNPIQQLAVEGGLDTTPDLTCLLVERNSGDDAE